MKLRALFVAAALAVAVLAAPGAANAATPAPITAIVVINVAPGSTITIAPAAGFNCGTGMFCVYNDANYSGTVTAYTNPTVGCHSFVGTPADNAVSSMHNFTTRDNTMDPSTNCNNFSGFVDHAGQSFQNLSGSGYNDTLSSFRVN